MFMQLISVGVHGYMLVYFTPKSPRSAQSCTAKKKVQKGSELQENQFQESSFLSSLFMTECMNKNFHSPLRFAQDQLAEGISMSFCSNNQPSVWLFCTELINQSKQLLKYLLL